MGYQRTETHQLAIKNKNKQIYSTTSVWDK